MDTHPCPIDRCVKTNLPEHLLMCKRHWTLVPPDLQRAVYAAYKNGRGLGTPELLDAQNNAINAVEERLRERRA